MKREAGLTLLELLTTVVMMGLITIALTMALTASTRYAEELPGRREAATRRLRFELDLSDLLRMAYISSTEGDMRTYFVAVSQSGQVEQADTLVFTTLAHSVSGAYFDARDADFEELNRRFGPQGGLAEVAISLVPVGETSLSGIFLRTQRPPDGDITQGGTERVLAEDVSELRFEFFDGETWQTTWDTREGARRIPGAVRVYYRFAGEEDDPERMLEVRPVLSDVTIDNPMVEGEGTADQGGGVTP